MGITYFLRYNRDTQLGYAHEIHDVPLFCPEHPQLEYQLNGLIKFSFVYFNNLCTENLETPITKHFTLLNDVETS